MTRSIVVVTCIVGASVAAGLLAACSGSSSTLSKVSGVVVDERSGMPLAGASVTGPGVAAISGADGVFVLAKVSKTADLRITAKNHNSLRVQAAKELGPIRLVPIPVMVKVSGDRTANPPEARVTGGTESVRAEGRSVALFGIGPGDMVTVAASGYESHKVKVPSSRELGVVLVRTVVAVIARLHTARLPLTTVVVYTAATDPNHLLDRPNQYIEKANWRDARDSNTSDTYSIEVFASAAELIARKSYLERVTKAAPFLCEYDSTHGLVLLRVSCQLTPDQEKQYESAVGT